MSFLDVLGPIGIFGMLASAVGIVGGAIGENSALKRESQSVELSSRQAQLEFQSKTLDSIASTNQLMATQETSALGEGVSSASPTVASIVKTSYDYSKNTENNYQEEANVEAAAAKAKEGAISDEESSSIFKAFSSLGALGIEGEMLA